MSADVTRKEMLIFGWARAARHKRGIGQQIPNELVQIIYQYCKDVFSWIITWNEFDQRKYSKRKCDINIDGIQLQLLLVYKWFDTYLELKLIRSSVPKDALTISVHVKTSGNVWRDCDEQKQKELLFDVYKDIDEKVITAVDVGNKYDDIHARKDMNAIELAIEIEILKIEYC